MRRSRVLFIARRTRALLTHADRLAECKELRPDFNIVVDSLFLTARWTDHDGSAKQTIARVALAEEMLVRSCLALIQFADTEASQPSGRRAKKLI